MTEVLLLLLALALAVVCGVFVAAEFSLTTVQRPELERAARDGERGAAGALRAVRALSFQLSGAQLGITVTGLVIGMITEPSLARLLTGPLTAAGLGAAAPGGALVLGTVVSSVVLMVVGELVPKNWAISRPLAVARTVAAPLRAFTAVFRPIITHLNRTANRVLRRAGLEPAEELASARGRQELEALARHSARLGALEPDTAELFVRVLNLADLTAENVMTPRVRVTALDERATAEDVANATRATGLSRFPVYRETLDDVVGVVLALWSLGMSLLFPIAKGLWHISTAPALRRTRRRAVAVTVGTVAVLAALLLAVPLPSHTLAQGVVGIVAMW